MRRAVFFFAQFAKSDHLLDTFDLLFFGGLYTYLQLKKVLTFLE